MSAASRKTKSSYSRRNATVTISRSRQTGAQVIEAESSAGDLECEASTITPPVFSGSPATISGPGRVAGRRDRDRSCSRNVPVIVDAAAQIPVCRQLLAFHERSRRRRRHLQRRQGIARPQTTGWCSASRRSSTPAGRRARPNHGFGRPMKVGKRNSPEFSPRSSGHSSKTRKRSSAATSKSSPTGWKILRGIPGVRVDRSFPSEAGQPYPRAFVHLSEPNPWIPDAVVDALWEGRRGSPWLPRPRLPASSRSTRRPCNQARTKSCSSACKKC